MSLPTQEPRKLRWRQWLGVALLLILLGDAEAWWVQTGGGTVAVSGFRLPTENGQWITADLFRPRTATAAHPAPLVLVCPGFERSKEAMSSYSIELARRGLVVIVIDPYNQGASSTTLQKRSATLEGYGLIPMAEYVAASTNFTFIDKTRIGAAGYSAGGNAVLQTAAHFGALEARALRHARADPAAVAAAHAKNLITAIFVGGYVLTLTDTVLASLHANAGLDYARYDEGAFRTENGTAQMSTAPEAARLVNSGLTEAAPLTQITLGQTYGSASNLTFRVVYNTKNIHPLLPYDPEHVARLVGFFQTVFDWPASLPAGNQIWYLKEFGTGLALIGALLSLVPLAAGLLERPLWAGLVHPLPPALPRPGRVGQWVFWGLFTLLAAAACCLFIPLARTTATLFPDATSGRPTWWFPERMNNAILLWAVANGTINLLVFFATYYIFGKKHGVRPAMWGLQTSLQELGQSALLAVILLGAFYGLLEGSYAVFHTDFRAIFVTAGAAFPPRLLWVALEYWPLFFIFYLANSLRVNGGNRFAGQPGWQSVFISGLGNSAGLLLILAIQYGHLAWYGSVFWQPEWLYTNLLLGVTPMMFILPWFHRAFFQLTGRVWLGPMVMCLVFILMMITGNVCYLPLPR